MLIFLFVILAPNSETVSNTINVTFYAPCCTRRRIYKGETFFQAALRKCKEETGLSGTAIQVLGVWNSFFPTSSWDTSNIHGTQTVGVPVLIEVQDQAEILLDDTSQRFRWTNLDPEEEGTKDEDQFIVQVLGRLKAWKSTFKRSD